MPSRITNINRAKNPKVDVVCVGMVTPAEVYVVEKMPDWNTGTNWNHRADFISDDAAIVAYAVGLGGVIPILTPQVAWPHYLLLTVPMLLVVIGNHPNPNSNQGQAPRWVPLIGILSIFVMCTGRRLLLLVSLNDYEYFSILIAFMLAGLILAASRQLLHKFSSPVASKG